MPESKREEIAVNGQEQTTREMLHAIGDWEREQKNQQLLRELLDMTTCFKEHPEFVREFCRLIDASNMLKYVSQRMRELQEELDTIKTSREESWPQTPRYDVLFSHPENETRALELLVLIGEGTLNNERLTDVDRSQLLILQAGGFIKPDPNAYVLTEEGRRVYNDINKTE